MAMEDRKLQKQKNTSRNRFVITSVVLLTFLLIMLGIGSAILKGGEQPNINQEWKEILLLVLGAFLGSYSRIIDFWFNGNDMNMDGVPDAAPPADDCPPCPDCNEPDDELDNLY
jgi:hypothetical protein